MAWFADTFQNPGKKCGTSLAVFDFLAGTNIYDFAGRRAFYVGEQSAVHNNDGTSAGRLAERNGEQNDAA